MNDRNESLDPLKRAALLRLLQQRGASRTERAPQDAIEAADRSAALPLSFAQQRLWFLDQLDHTASVAYHMPAALRLTGNLDRSALKSALDHLVARHESLRTTFEQKGEQPVQVIAAADSGFVLVEQDLRGQPPEQARLSATRISEAEAAEPFDLLKGPLIRGRLLQVSDKEHLLLITQHHIISDGWSIEVLVREFSVLYEAFVNSQPNPLPPLSIQYADYAAWQRQRMNGELQTRHLDFWRNQLSGAPALLTVPTDRPRPPVQSHEGSTLKFTLPKDLSQAIGTFAQLRAATPFMTLMAAWAVLLTRLSGQQDVVIGTVAANRDRQDVQGLIGFFANTLALRVRLQADPSLDEVMAQVRNLMLESSSYQDTPFDLVVEALKPPRSASHSPIFQTMLYTNAGNDAEQLSLPGLTLEFLSSRQEDTQHDLSLHIDEGGEQLVCSLSYSTALFDASTIERLSRRFERVLRHFTDAPQTRIGALDLDPDLDLPQVQPTPYDAQQTPLSWHQERIWFVDTFETGYLYGANPIYHNIPLLLALSGEINNAALQTALNGLMARHEILRCRVLSDSARAWQRFETNAALPLKCLQAATGQCAAIALEDSAQPLHMDGGALVRATLVQDGTQEAVLAITVHHLLADRASMQIIKRDLLELYDAACSEREPQLPELPVAYRDFAQWQRQLPAATRESLRSFWAYQLRGKLQPMELPLNRPRAAVHVFTPATHAFALTAKQVKAVEAAARRAGVSSQSLALSAFTALLRRYAGHDELVVGTTAACREDAALQNMVGPVGNLLVLRGACDENTSLQGLLTQTAIRLAQAHKHRYMQFDQLVLAINPDKDMSRTALFDVLFNFEQARQTPEQVAGLGVRTLETSLGYGKNDLHLLIVASEAQWQGHMTYNADFFDQDFIAQLMQHFVRLLDAFAGDTEQAVDDIPLLDEQEKLLQALHWNDTEADYPADATLHQLFEAQVLATPEHIAVNSDEGQLTYKALNERANRLAHRLRASGVATQELIAILLDRSLDMIVSTLAVLKAGAAYVPIDPASPADRMAYILKDSGVRKIIARAETAKSLADTELEVFDPASQDKERSTAANLDNLTAPGHLCYVIYTSGSTGQPKGTLLEHRNVVRLLHNSRSPFSFGSNDVWTLFHSNAFDFSVWEIFGALLHGGRLVLVPEPERRDPALFLDFLEREQVTVLNQTPSAFLPLSEAALGHQETALRTLKYVIFGGESLEVNRLAAFHGAFPEVALVNMYGITETCVHVTFKHIKADDINVGISNVGRPIPTTVTYVMDGKQRLLPVGVPGEICVGGLGVGRGYLNRPELTAERFIDDPLRPGERLYRSGDLGKLLSNGEIVHLGRMDAQVKIRGFRIELGEIEAKLLACDGVHEVRVLARDDARQGKRLIAYLIPEPGAAIEVAALRKQLGATLPDYMVPSAFVSLNAYPLTANGKLDNDALPAAGVDSMSERGYEAPQGATEQALAQIYQELLGVERVGRRDGFFELGGHSLLAAQLVSRVRQVLGGELMLRELFSHPTVEELARVIGTLEQASVANIQPVNREAPLVLSFSQQRLWFLDQLDPNASIAYHMPASLLLRGDLNTQALKAALNHLVARHEGLRTTFKRIGEQPVQVIAAPDSGFTLTEHDLRALPFEEAQSGAARIAQREAAAPFDLQQGPLIRGSLVRLADDEHRLHITQHHIISDGWSVGVLVKEFAELYEVFASGNTPSLEPLAIQYADYAAWQRATLAGPQLASQLEQWREHLGGAPTLLTLPTDRPRPALQSYRGADVPLTLSPQLLAQVERCCKQHNVTLFMVLLSAWSVLMARLGNERDVVIGVPTANRGNAQVESLIGFFVNTLPVRVQLQDSPSVAQLLAQVRDTLLAVHERQEVPFEHVIEALQPPRSLSYNPLCQVALSLNNTPDNGPLELPGLALTALKQSQETAQFDLMLTLAENAEGLEGVIQYASDLFERATVERFAQSFQVLLQALVQDSEQPVMALPLLTPAQQQAHPALRSPVARFATHTLIHQRFEAFAARQPAATALVIGDCHVSYQELNRRANRIAMQLLDLRVTPDSLVGILAERSVDMLCAVIAVLKAGAAYVPLDPAYPKARLTYLLEDSQPLALIAQPACLDKLGFVPAIPVVALGLETDREAAADPTFDHNPTPDLAAQHLAYVIYTSGSTGQPKGVLVEHGHVARLFDATADNFQFGVDDTWTLFHSFAFDFSVWEIWGALSYGGRLVIVPTEIARSPDDFHALVCREQVTVLNQTPSAFRQFIDAAGRNPEKHVLQEVIFGGEALDIRTLRPWILKTPLSETRLVNMYGITEITVHATFHEITQAEIDAGDTGLIGAPLSDLCLRILDAYQQPVPIGVEGEIYIGGAGVARHYLNRAELNAERFIADPYTSHSGARLYRTGDVARYRADGAIVYVGRNDSQIKIRGFRIELGEIEARLQNCDGVREALVILREDVPGDKRLVAYLIVQDNVTLELSTLRSRLAETLAEHMIPSAFITLTAWPLTTNGKLDRGALPAPDGSVTATREYQAPEGPLEIALANAWGELLGIERIGREDHFFELGGHSFLVISLIERLRQNGMSLNVRNVFSAPTLKAMAMALDASPGAVGATIAPNLIPDGCDRITPQMLTLVTLTPAEIELIVADVPGGARNVQDIYPLSSLQEGILFHHLLQARGDAYLMRTVVKFKRRERLDQFLAALQSVIDRHDILRTSLRWSGLPKPVQVVQRQAMLPVTELDSSQALDPLLFLHEHTDTQTIRLDLQQAPLIAAYVTWDRHGDQWLLTLLDHHLISDNVTLRLIMAEIYTILHGEGHSLPPSHPYRNFIAQAAMLSQQEHETYFRQLLGDVEETTAPYGVLDVQSDGAGNTKSIRYLSDEVSAAVHRVAKAQGVPNSVLFHAAWGLVVAATSGRDDVVFGTVLSGRSQGAKGADQALGMFINTLPMRIRLGNRSVSDIVQDAYQQLSELLTHEQASLALAQRCSAVDASMPLFTVILNCRHGEMVTADGGNIMEMDDWDGIEFAASETHTNYPIEIAVATEGGAISLTSQTIAGIDPQRIADYLAQAVTALVEALETAPLRLAATLDILPDEERQQVLYGFNQTVDDLGTPQPMPVLFEAQVRAQPDAIALVHDDQQLTYTRLNRRANQLAQRLLMHGIQPEQRVAICAQRGIEMIVALLAVLKAGGAYVPIDPDHPTERIAFILKDSAARLLLCQQALTPHMPAAHDCPALILLDEHDASVIDNNPQYDENIDSANLGLTSDNLAYVIYTSGSTGQSKGVMVEHRSVFNFAQVMARTTHAHCPPQAHVALNAGFYFDMSIKGIAQLLFGHRLVIIPAMIRASGSELLDFLERHQVHAFDSTPSQLDALLAAGLLERSRYQPVSVLLGGEAINTATWDKLRQSPRIRFYNMYGPTECTVDATLGLIQELGERPSIGRPLANMQVLVLDPRGQPVPIGVIGELYIGGAGVARGYLNNPKMTHERFIPHPFSDDPRARLYRTGDLGRWRADGALEYAGRNDFQVKIRGFRIELGEIESALLACAGVREAVVIAREDTPGESASSRLVAYLCGAQTSAEELRARLLDRLPEYMVPSAFVQLDMLPLTANGKLDRRALPAPGQDALASRTYEAPQGEVEQAIAGIWQELLHVERVGRHDGFLELGGHSLLAVQLLSRLRRKLGTRLTLRELFDDPTVRGLAAQVAAASPEQNQTIPRANRKDRLALSFSQQRLWFLNHLDAAAGAAYHLPIALRLSGELDPDALHAALDRLVARHEILRTAFVLTDGEPEQKIAPADRRFDLVRQDLRGLSAEERSGAVESIGEANATELFDLACGPMIRGYLVQTADTEHVLFITLHHIISDGWSNSVLAREMSVLYDAFSRGVKDPLPALPLQYADYAVWQRQWLQGAALKAQTDFWRTHLQGAPALLNLPLNRPRPAIQSYAGAIIDFSLPAPLSEQLRKFSQAQGTTLFMTLLAGWSTLMTHLSGQDDVVVGTPVANRQRTELESLIGFFANTLALRVKGPHEAKVVQLLEQIKDQTLAAFNHQDLPFEQVVSILQPTRNMSHSPLFQVMLSLDNTPAAPLKLPGLEIESLQSAHHTTQFDLSLSLTEDQGTLFGSMQYASDLFDKATVQTIIDLFRLNLTHLVTDAQQTIAALLEKLPTLARSESVPSLQASVADKMLELPYEAPQGDTEQAIARIWRELFQNEQISRHDDFFKLGGISLMAVQMASRLRKVLGKPIAVRDLFVEPTVAGFARTLDLQSGSSAQSNLVPIRRSGSQRPLFLVHPLGGEVQYVRDLAPSLNTEIPVYGLAASGFGAGEKTSNTISAIATNYLAAIREVQPEGPYRFAGWSAGGLIAHEMAHQAIASGETVEFLGIIDTSVHKVPPAQEPISLVQFLLEWMPENLESPLKEALQTHAAQNEVEEMIALCASNDLLAQELGKGIDARVLRTHLMVAYAIRNAVDAYISPVTDVTVSLFTARDQERTDPTLGWSELQGDRLFVTPLRGEHNTLVKEPYVSALGEAISLALKRL